MPPETRKAPARAPLTDNSTHTTAGPVLLLPVVETGNALCSATSAVGVRRG